MTDSDEWAGLRVTDSPELDAQLREHVDTMTSRELAEYAHSLGLYPPCFEDGSNPPIALVWLPDMPIEAEGILMWDARPDEETAERP